MRDVCDVAYALLLEERRAMVLTDRQAAIAAMAAGADIDIPDWYTEREGFDEALMSEPEFTPVDRERQAIRRALGLPDRVGR